MATKTLRNFQIVGALYSGVGAGAQEAQAGDSIRIFLNQVANPDFPVSIDGIIQPPVSAVNVIDNGGHAVEGRSYTLQYDSDDLEGSGVETLSACDIIEISVISCCVAVSEALDAEVTARAAADTALQANIDEVQEDLDTWDVVELSDEPVNGVAGVPQVETQTVIGTIATAGTVELTITVDSLDYDITFDVDAGDVPSITAAKAAAAIEEFEAVATLYDVDNIGSSFALTAKEAYTNDNTLNIAITNGTATGLTPDASSTNTVSGVAAIVGTVAARVGQHAQWGSRIWEATDTSPNTWVEITTERNSIMVDAGNTDLFGGAGNLDGIEVTSADAGRFQVTVTDTTPPLAYLHELIADSSAESVPDIIRPDNFDAGDPVVWILRHPVTVSAAILDASAGGNGTDDFGLVPKYQNQGSLAATFSFDLYKLGTNFCSSWDPSNLTATHVYFTPNFDGTMALEATVVAATPTTGFTITATAKLDQSHYLTPAGTLATGTFTLPTAANSRAGQIVRLWSTQIVTALTVNVSGGGSILGTALTAAAANTPYAYQCVSTTGTGTWIRLQ